MNTAVIGFGDAGCRVLNKLIAQGFPADFIAVDTNKQSLSACLAHEKFLIRRNDDMTGVDLHDGARVHSALTRRSGASFITDGAPVLDALQDMDKTIWVAGLGGACAPKFRSKCPLLTIKNGAKKGQNEKIESRQQHPGRLS